MKASYKGCFVTGVTPNFMVVMGTQLKKSHMMLFLVITSKRKDLRLREQDLLVTQVNKWVSTFVRTCEICQQVKPSAQAAAPLARLRTLRVLGVHYSYGLSVSPTADNTGIVISVDRLSKMDHLAAVPDTIDGEGTARLLIDRVF